MNVQLADLGHSVHRAGAVQCGASSEGKRHGQRARRLGVAFGALVLWLATAPHALSQGATAGAVAASEDRRRLPLTPFRFRVTKGTDKVCRAYADNLNRIAWHTEPFCFRAIAPESPGFWQPQLVPVDAEDLQRIWPDISALLAYGDTTTYFQQNPNTRKGLLDHARSIAEMDRYAATQGAIRLSPWAAPNKFRYVPALDIDNDGTPDDVVFSRETWYSCGGDEPNNPYPRIAAVDAFFLGPDGKIDVARTEALFYPGARKRSIPADAPSPSLRSGWAGLPRQLGIFQFEGRAFIDNYGRRPSSKPRSGILEVYEFRNSKRSHVCDIAWAVDAGGAKKK